MGIEHVQSENRANSQPFLLCGKPLDFHAILQSGIESTQISGEKLKPPMKMVRFEEVEGSKEGFDVYVSETTILIAPIGVDPRKAYLDPKSPLVFTAYAPKYADKVVFTARTRHADNTYDSRFPRGRALLYEAMKFLDSTHHDPMTGRSTIRTMEAEFVEPNFTSRGNHPGVASDNYTAFMNRLEEIRALDPQKFRRFPELLKHAYQEIAAHTWATKYAANPLGFTEITEALVIPSASPEEPTRIGVWYKRPEGFTTLASATEAA